MDWSTYYKGLLKTLGIIFLPAILKTGIYYFIFRKLGYTVTLLICFLAAFIPFIMTFVIPIHLPTTINFVLGIATQVFVFNHYTDIEMFPRGLTVIGVVEVVFYVIQTFLL
ncbi:MAG: hypothetical protein WC209_17975 [Ignavibacteriaceae bacterium]|jgi:hypothetical protein